MCGIAGIFSFDDKEIGLQFLQQINEILHHRGPDHQAIYNEDKIALTYQRLSIQDLSEKGYQPWQNDNFVLVYNGEIYNFKELREQLKLEHNIEFSSGSDTEVLFQLLVTKGISNTLTEIQGMYAFAFYDKTKRLLYLVRDRLGIKPLFYQIHKNHLYFASESKALSLILPQIIQDAQIPNFINGNIEKDRKETGFVNIHQIEPGTVLTIQADGQMNKSIYYENRALVSEAKFKANGLKSERRLIAELSDHLEASIQKMLLSDAPIGVFLSGGLDSALITALALKQKKDIQLFSVDVVGNSEIQKAESLTKSFGKELNKIIFNPQDFIENWVETTYYYDAPIIVHPNSVPFQLLAAQAHANIKVILTGEGADELFLGYVPMVQSAYKPLFQYPFKVFQSFLSRNPIKNRNRENKSQIIDYCKEFGFVENTRKKLLLAESIHYLDYHLLSLLVRNDRMGMMHNIEARFPFLDEAIVNFCTNLPLKYKIRNSAKFYNRSHPFLIDKYLLRKVALKHLPRGFAMVPKIGFPVYAPFQTKTTASFFQNGFLAQTFKWDKQTLKNVIYNIPDHILYRYISVEIWGRLFLYKEQMEPLQQFVNSKVKLK